MRRGKFLWFSKNVNVLKFDQNVNNVDSRVDLHGNAYQHKTVKMFDVVSALQLFSLTSCYWLSFSLVIFLFSQLYTDMWRLADPHIHVMGKKVGSIKLKIIFKKILNCHVMLYRIKMSPPII